MSHTPLRHKYLFGFRLELVFYERHSSSFTPNFGHFAPMNYSFWKPPAIFCIYSQTWFQNLTSIFLPYFIWIFGVDMNSRISLLVLMLTFVYENIMKISRLKHRKWKKMKTFSNPILVVGNAGSSGTGLCYRFCKRKQFLTIYDFRFRLGKPKKSCYCRKNVS